MLNNCNVIARFGPLVGRILLSAIFIIAGWKKLTGFEGTLGYMVDKGLPFTEILLVLTIIIELGGGLLILLGWQARWAALAIFLFLIPVSIIFHPFWADPGEFNSFFKNLAIMGGMAYIVTHGSGPFSLGKD
ncbi:MAG: DoxX family protein [Gammaproteobacteria bacterium]|nr:DoxX family protein [Gammaproteobacteria bacterium]